MQYIYQGQLKVNLRVFLGRLGYHEHQDRRSGQVSYIRRLGGLDYPRFHLYLKDSPQGIVFNLHLDEKKPSYAGQTAHSGEYGGELVQGEMDRIGRHFSVV